MCLGSAQKIFRVDRQVADADTRGIENGVADRCGRTDGAQFADAACANVAEVGVNLFKYNYLMI